LAAEHVALAAEHVALAAGTKRANKCMQDWTNQQVIERVRILELELELEQQQPQGNRNQQQQQPPKKCKCKAQKKEIKRLADRLALLENASANATIQACNPFDFNAICDPWEKEDEHADECMPALDLIYALAPLNLVQPVVANDAVVDADDDDDDDMFEVVQIFDLPTAK